MKLSTSARAFELAAGVGCLLSWIRIADFDLLASVIENGTTELEREAPSFPFSEHFFRCLSLWRSRGSRQLHLFASSNALIEECKSLSATILHPRHCDYPLAFFALEKPPIFLSSVGGTPWKHRSVISIFGGREPSVSALRWMDQYLPEVFLDLPWSACSGGARGIDRRAHQLSHLSGAPTIVFLPSGLKQVYPADLKPLLNEYISIGGAVLSEFPPARSVARHFFERRNRMIAALGSIAFAVEGGRRSGTMMTAQMALQLGKPLCVLPQSPMEACALGTLDLLHDGAHILRDRMDLIQLMRSLDSESQCLMGAKSTLAEQ